MKALSFSECTALVCGASRGIGLAASKLLAQQGCQVVLVARNETSAKAAAESLPKVKRGPHFELICDLSQTEQIKERISKLLTDPRLQGSVQILVNNTGGPAAGLLHEAKEEQLHAAFTQHVIGAQALAQILLPEMRAQGFGRIVNVLSTSVRAPIAGLGVSNTIRAAMAGWAKTLSNECAPFGVTVNNVLPGYTTTERFYELLEGASRRLTLSLEETEQKWRSAVPMGRFATPEEVAWAVLFFANPLSSYITGQSLAVDGGRTPSI